MRRWVEDLRWWKSVEGVLMQCAAGISINRGETLNILNYGSLKVEFVLSEEFVYLFTFYLEFCFRFDKIVVQLH